MLCHCGLGTQLQCDTEIWGCNPAAMAEYERVLMGRGPSGGDEQEQDLDEAASRFESTLGGNEPPEEE